MWHRTPGDIDARAAQALGGVYLVMTGDSAIDRELQNRALAIVASAFGTEKKPVVAVAANRCAIHFVDKEGTTSHVGSLPVH